MKTEVNEHLHQVLSVTYELYLKTQICHWNVTGPNFYSLHKLLEAHYEDLAESVDNVAERIRALGEKVVLNSEDFARDIKSNSVLTGDSNGMLKCLVEVYDRLEKELNNLADIAAKHDDKVTEDMAVDWLKEYAEQKWMLRSSL